MVNKEFIKDISKAISKSDIGGELAPGEVGRRYEPEYGIKKHNERIHRESKLADNNKNMEFTFSKPKKPARSRLVRCLSCGKVSCGNKNTVGIICSECRTFSKVEEVIDNV